MKRSMNVRGWRRTAWVFRRCRLRCAAGRTCTEHGDALIGERHAGDIDGGQQGTRRNGRRALDIVIEGTEPVTIALEQARRIVLRETFPAWSTTSTSGRI